MHSTLYEISVAQHLRLLIWVNIVCPCPKIRAPGPYIHMLAFGLSYLKLSDLLAGRRFYSFLVKAYLLRLWKRNYFKYVSSTHITSTTAFCETTVCRTYNFFFKPKSHLHDFGPSTAKIHPVLLNHDASV